MPQRRVLLAALSIVALADCRESSDPSALAPLVSSSATAPNRDTISPSAMLDSMDKRTPVPLLPMMANHQKQNMRDHLLAVKEIVSAISTNDFDAVEKSSARIGYSEQMGRMCNHMGAGAPGFTELALDFHHTADRIGDAAKKKDHEAVLKALGETLSTCTGCHERFKQQVVDEAAWSAATKTAAPAAPAKSIH